MAARTIRRKIGFALVVLAGTLCATEATVRLAGVIVHREIREADVAASPAPAGRTSKLLVCAGDSVTYGMPYDPEKGWPRALQAALGDSGIEVANSGWPGANLEKILSEAERRLVEGGIGHPAALILLGGHNDCSYLRSLAVARRPVSEASRSVRELLRHSYAWRLLTQVVVHAQNAVSRRDVPVIPEDAELQRCHDGVAKGMAAARALGERRGIDVLVVDYPITSTWYADPYPGPFYDTFLLDEELRAAAGREGLPLFATRDCLAAEEARLGRSLSYGEGVHLHAEGYAALGRCLAPRVRDLVFRPVRNSVR
jgi:lysophospholipase L1-like esterase